LNYFKYHLKLKVGSIEYFENSEREREREREKERKKRKSFFISIKVFVKHFKFLIIKLLSTFVYKIEN